MCLTTHCRLLKKFHSYIDISIKARLFELSSKCTFVSDVSENGCNSCSVNYELPTMVLLIKQTFQVTSERLDFTQEIWCHVHWCLPQSTSQTHCSWEIINFVRHKYNNVVLLTNVLSSWEKVNFKQMIFLNNNVTITIGDALKRQTNIRSQRVKLSLNTTLIS